MPSLARCARSMMPEKPYPDSSQFIFCWHAPCPTEGALGASQGASMRPAWWACYKVFQTAQRLWQRTSIKILSKTPRFEVVKCNFEDANSPQGARRPASRHDGGYLHRPAI